MWGVGLPRLGSVNLLTPAQLGGSLQRGSRLWRLPCPPLQPPPSLLPPPPAAGATLFQVTTGSGSPWALQGSCTLVPTSTVLSLGVLANTGVTAKQGRPADNGGDPKTPVIYTKRLHRSIAPCAQPGQAQGTLGGCQAVTLPLAWSAESKKARGKGRWSAHGPCRTGGARVKNTPQP